MALRKYHVHSTKTAGPVNAAGDAANIASDVRVLDETGGVLKSLSSIAKAGFVRLTNGTVEALLKAANAAVSVASIVLGVQLIGQDGQATPSGADTAHPIFTSSAGGMLLEVLGNLPAYFSPVHLAAAWASATTIDILGVPFDPVIQQFVGVLRWTAAGNVEWLSPDDAAYQFGWVAGVPGAGVLTITGATLVNTDEYVVIIAGIEHGYSLADNAWLDEVQNWPVNLEPHGAHEDTTNLDPNGDGSPGNSYYPAVTGFELVGNRSGSLQYKLLDATLTLQGKNHDALDWQDCTPSGWNSIAGGPAPIMIGGAGLARDGLLEFQSLTFDQYRIAIGTFDATNTCELDFRLRA